MTRRIALISDHASPLALLGGVDSGGQNVYVGQVAKHLAAIGYDVDVFTRRDNPMLPDIASWVNGVRIVNVPAGPPSFVRKEDLLPYMADFADFIVSFCRRRRQPYDLLHANFFMSGFVAAEVKRRLDIPFVITFHALGRVRRQHQSSTDEFPDDRFEIEGRCVEEADRVIVECPQEEEDLVKLYHAEPARLSLIPAGVDLTEFWPLDRGLARANLGVDPDERVVLQLGRMVPRKGVDTVIRGFAHLVNEMEVPSRLWVVGGDPDASASGSTKELRRLMDVASDEGVADRVSFFGRRNQDELKYFYSAADVFATTPWYEPFGITPLEAMACGTSVVGANVGGIRFTVRDGETGYLVPPKDHLALAERLAHLFANPRLRELFGLRGTRRVKDMFSWPKIAGSLAALYEEVLASREAAWPDEASLLATIDTRFSEATEALSEAHRLLRTPVIEAAVAVTSAFKSGGKVLICGNGGSAADAQHMAAELVGRFKRKDRPGMPAIALGTDPSVSTAVANDDGFDTLFSRQVEALGAPGDVLIVMSTSGRSPNLVRALEQASAMGMRTVALLGRGGGDARALSEQSIVVPSDDTQRIQEVHSFLVHLLCELVEERVFAGRILTPVASTRNDAPPARTKRPPIAATGTEPVGAGGSKPWPGGDRG